MSEFCPSFSNIVDLPKKKKNGIFMENVIWYRISITSTAPYVKSLSPVGLFATPWTVAYQASQSMGFSRQEYWSGLPFPSPSGYFLSLIFSLTFSPAVGHFPGSLSRMGQSWALDSQAKPSSWTCELALVHFRPWCLLCSLTSFTCLAAGWSLGQRQLGSTWTHLGHHHSRLCPSN